LAEKLEKFNLSSLAKSFITRLLARAILDRYRVHQALSHPWITRNFNEKVPLTQNEQNSMMECEIKLKNAQSIILFLALA
jgi:calcium/calmodulin-dependent protein kinase I